jgi:protein-S-isoprenylcysteine O-methyltransferase Ste14
MLLGTWLLIGDARFLAAFLIFVVLVEIKLHIEERLMLAEFPDDYPRYRR